MEPALYHLIVYVPHKEAENMRKVLANAGAGNIGNYDSCSFSVRGTGRFRPNADANPAIGAACHMEEVDEERIEAVVTHVNLHAVVRAVKKAHSYEEPAIHILPMLDYKVFL
ncbi:hypothetical protein COU78_02555 [Candidatus Peregrinibacteria bacterium CG10_big_fil_rev_8_21_14_0_10_49_24]|nr:MAG: hypothetical protein COV83_02535 [Candidatus Peregrinibacteria bacterium CG11_big_fil_rev_8_21_14_0_20_49_14]PIR51018.1 MAG: hypothetical protein COU78_02555 [Candidatus Peregrinibacteria bacterium CG10_big_fil_rev_8_21_14_0_10_49_24]PJA67571.1 MAG: hypothetical protein CO157_04035 [Candidatus Peregrinibacteria bacterium CG_4_9_14_3_um_filter_49_12]